jgi:hypothetical protein
MTTSGHHEDSDNSELEIKRPAGNGSRGILPQASGGSLPLARRGAGPRTMQGKEKSSQNSLIHGILSKAVVLKGESQDEFDALLNGLCEHFQPVGAFEEGQVEMLAATRWRQRRVLIAEAAEIQAGTEFIEWDERQRQKAEAAAFSLVEENGGLMRRISNPEAVQSCLALLDEIRQIVEAVGFKAPNTEHNLAMLYGDFDVDRWNGALSHSYRSFSQIANSADDFRKRGGNPSPEECKKFFLKELAAEKKRLKRWKQERDSIEASRLKLEVQRRSVPISPRLDQLIRYSASLERTFERTLNQLECAQRMRLGQPVPPPLNVNVALP